MKDNQYHRRYNSVLHKKYRYIMELLPDDLENYTIMEYGTGEGFNAYLIRTLLKGNPHIEGIDIWKPYVDMLQKINLYNSVYEADIMAVAGRKKKVDYSIITAVIEHLPKSNSIWVLNRLKENTTKRIIVSVPLDETLGKQDSHYQNNPFNAHISSWSEKDLSDLGFETFTYDLRTMTRSIKMLDDIRRWITFKAKFAQGLIAWFDGVEN
jgi:hypothetical protein